MPAATDANGIAPADKAGATADWALTRGAAALQLTSVATRQNLSVASSGRRSPLAARTVSHVLAQGFLTLGSLVVVGAPAGIIHEDAREPE